MKYEGTMTLVKLTSAVVSQFDPDKKCYKAEICVEYLKKAP